jgi:hypothetical protein
MGLGGLVSKTFIQWLTFRGQSMQIKYECRVEKKLTTQTICKVADTLPPYVEVIQCNSCGVMGVAILDKETAYSGNL